MLNRHQGTRRFPTKALLERAEFTNDAGVVRFVDTAHAALHWCLTAHTLEVYRSLGGGPAFYKFGRWVRYAITDPAPNTEEQRLRLVPAPAAACYLGLALHSLKLHRRADTGPDYYKFGSWVRYAVRDLDAWAENCRWHTTSIPARVERTYLVPTSE